MAYEANIITDSITESEHRLTTIQVTLPRFVLAEYNTHRVFSRNSASSRAIPVEKQITKVLDDPVIPIYWGKNQPGMKAREELSGMELKNAQETWLTSRDYAVLGAVALNGGINNLKNQDLVKRIAEIEEMTDSRYSIKEPSVYDTPVHKQIANRLLEPFMWQTIITTATDWDNFYALRAHQDAQPEIQQAARLMQDAFNESEPTYVKEGEWHLPLIQTDEKDWAKENVLDAIKVSVGRCARVSYLTHEGRRDISKDIELHDTLVSAGHMSPTEHVATPMDTRYTKISKHPYSGNIKGWIQYRKTIDHEDNYAEAIQAREKLHSEGIDLDG